MKYIDGGITAAKGFTASGVHCGIRKNKEKKDLALILSDRDCTAAGVYTQNLVKGAPIFVTKNNLMDGHAKAIICNSGNANTCNANGVEIAEAMCTSVAKHTGIQPTDVIVASTGVIGQELDITPIENGMDALVKGLSHDGSNAAEAIMTTDLAKKEVAVEFACSGIRCKLGGIAKGSGMIHPNMATMLVFLTTDVAISPELLHDAILCDSRDSFNMVSVDGDTSTNDMLCILANGASGAPLIDSPGEAYETFKQALSMVTTKLCRMIARDGEGATKLVTCTLTGAKEENIAKAVAKAVICSSLVKAAMFGADANWGRVLCAIGYAGCDVDIDKVAVEFISKAGNVVVCEHGAGVPFSEDLAKTVLTDEEVTIAVNLNDGSACATAWGCDLTYDYVKINGDYRT